MVRREGLTNTRSCSIAQGTVFNVLQRKMVEKVGKGYMYVCITESPCCIAEIKHNVGSQLYFSIIKRHLMRQKPLSLVNVTKELDELE